MADDLTNRLVTALGEVKEVLRFALLCTTPEIAAEGMTYIRRVEALLDEHARAARRRVKT